MEVQANDTANSIVFYLHQREVLRFEELGDGSFHVRIPQGVPATTAAREFVEVLEDQIPKLRLICASHQGNA